MNGPEHFREAERLLENATKLVKQNEGKATASQAARDVMDGARLLVAKAQVHATLAHAAAQVTTACASVGSIGVLADWKSVGS